MVVDGLAKKALLEAVIAKKLSPVLVEQRADDVRAAFEPIDELLGGFSVVTREDLDGSRVRVTCEADVDLATALLRMVSSKVLSFEQSPPRILLLPTAGTSAATMRAIRTRLGSTLEAAGFVLLAAEATAAATVLKVKVTPTEVAAMTRQVAETRADLIALVDLTVSPAPSPVGGFVLDGTLQYTVVRPRDNAIVAEHVFNARGSGATQMLAEQALLAEIAPQMGRDLAGRLAEAIFADGDVIDGIGALDGSVTVNVFFRPSAAATSALVDLLRSAGTTVSMGSSALAGLEAEVRNRVGDAGFATKKLTPADRLIVSGRTSVEQLYDLFARGRFGSGRDLRVSVIEYGDNYLGVEILAPAEAPRAAPTARPSRPDAGTSAQKPSATGANTPASPGRSAVTQTGSKAPLVFRRKLTS